MIIPISKNKLYWIALSSAIVALGLWVVRGQQQSPDEVWRAVSGGITLTAFISLMFEQWLWKYFPEYITGTPHLCGTWRGAAEYTWNEIDGAVSHGSIAPFYISLHQTFSTTTVTVHTDQSSSTSASCTFYKDAGGAWTCLYAYENKPMTRLLDESRPHRGAGQLTATLVGSNYQLELEYWTDRWTRGQARFDKSLPKAVSSFAAAQHLFGATT